MTTERTYAFDPQLAEIFDEAFERAGVDPAAPGIPLIQSARRSLRFMLNSEWSGLGQKSWQIGQAEEVMTVGKTSFFLPPGAIDIVDAVLRVSGKDTEMYPYSRDEYLTLASKTNQGRPDRYFVDKQRGRKECFIWQAGRNTTDIMIYNYFRQVADATNANTPLKDTLDMPTYAVQACTTGLAWHLALKFAPARAEMLRELYGGPQYPSKIAGFLQQMLIAGREPGDISLYPSIEPRTSRR